MSKRFVLGGLAATAVLLAGGVAFSGNPPTTLDPVTDYDTGNHLLWGYPQGQQIAQDFLHSAETQHLLADLSRFHPPQPCFPIAVAWNFMIHWDEKHGTNSVVVYEFLLTLAAANSCSVSVTSGGGSPPALLTVGPTAP